MTYLLVCALCAGTPGQIASLGGEAPDGPRLGLDLESDARTGAFEIAWTPFNPIPKGAIASRRDSSSAYERSPPFASSVGARAKRPGVEGRRGQDRSRIHEP